MSHFTTIKTQIKDIAALRSACEELKLPLLQHTEARGYAGQPRRGDLVIKLNGPYAIAVHQQPDGTLRLPADEGHGHLAQQHGSDLCAACTL